MSIAHAGASILGALAGAALLLSLPASAFKAIVPVFIAVALVLIVIQPRLSRMLEARRVRARTGRRLSPQALRAIIVIVAIVRLLA
jgi:uncharacterized protein